MAEEPKAPKQVEMDWLKAFDKNGHWAEIASHSQNVMAQFFRQATEATALTPSMSQGGLTAFANLFESFLRNPQKVADAQTELLRKQGELLTHIMAKAGVAPEAQSLPSVKDRRFRSEEWDKNLACNALMHSYLIGSEWLRGLVADSGAALTPRDRKNVAFYTNQMIDAASPGNFLLTNPDALKKTVESGGENLVKGLSNLLADFASGAGHVRRADESAFELGKTIAATEGSVVLRTPMMELLQFEPSTPQVHAVPLMLIPPWVNKYYLFDLQKKSSFIKWAVDQGFTVFAISWVNPDESYADKDFQDYWLEGPAAAFEAIEKITGQRHVNLIGYCLGGTLTVSGLACLAGQNDDRVSSATMVATLTDFSDFGDFEVFITEDQIDTIESYLASKPTLDAGDLSRLFSLLRANDLIWSSAISSYLLAEDAVASDLLYWFSDGIGMPTKMLDTFLRKVILANDLTKPGALKFGQTPLDLQKIATPLYFVSLKDDHVAHWEQTYRGAQNFKAPKTFVLGGSGHNAGTINPPAANKHGYWTNPEISATPEAWFAKAERHEGSWWILWSQFLRDHSGPLVEARPVAAGPLPVLEPAPGSYARLRR
jgi:polyhydroxyalkanoate synthase